MRKLFILDLDLDKKGSEKYRIRIRNPGLEALSSVFIQVLKDEKVF